MALYAVERDLQGDLESASPVDLESASNRPPLFPNRCFYSVFCHSCPATPQKITEVESRGGGQIELDFPLAVLRSAAGGRLQAAGGGGSPP